MRPYDVIKILSTADVVANDNLTPLISRKTDLIEGVCWGLWPSTRDTQESAKRRKKKNSLPSRMLHVVPQAPPITPVMQATPLKLDQAPS